MTIPSTPSDPPTRPLDTPCGRIAIRDVGRGPLIVAVHGLPGSGRDFRWLGASVEPRARFVRVDLPPFGDTPTRGGYRELTLDARARVVAAVIEALDAGPALLVGHSFGGTVAAATAVGYPATVRALALISTPGVRRHAAIRARRALSVGAWLLRRRVTRPLLLPSLRRRMKAMGFPRTSDAEMIATFTCLGWYPQERHRAHIDALTAPTLVAYAKDDRLVQPAILAELAERCPAGPRLVFDDGGHNPQKAHAVEIGDALVELAASVFAAC